MILGIYPSVTPRIQTKNNQQSYMPKTNYKAVSSAIPFGMNRRMVLNVLGENEKMLLRFLNDSISEPNKNLIETLLHSHQFKIDKPWKNLGHSRVITDPSNPSMILTVGYGLDNYKVPYKIHLWDKTKNENIARITRLNNELDNSKNRFFCIEENGFNTTCYLDQNGKVVEKCNPPICRVPKSATH